MAVEYQGDEFLYLVRVSDEGSEIASTHRFFNQTDGARTIEADEVELNTKDKSGSDYGLITESVSLEGLITEGDPAVDFIKRSIRNKQLVEITEVNTRTLDAETGMYMLSSLERTYTNGEYATYAIEGTLNGAITESELTEIPEGAPDEDIEIPAGIQSTSEGVDVGTGSIESTGGGELVSGTESMTGGGTGAGTTTTGGTAGTGGAGA